MQKLKYAVQLVFVLSAIFIGYRHQYVGRGPTGFAPIDAYCPFGAMATMPTYFFKGEYIFKTAISNFWLLGALLLSVMLVGAVFCGWLCPLGTLSEWLYKLRLAVYKKKITLPTILNNRLSYLRYIVLFLVIFQTYRSGKLIFENIDPYKAFFHMNIESLTTWAVIIVFILLSLYIERFWCRFLCPLGAVIGLFGKISLFKIVRDKSFCIKCRKCDAICPTEIKVSNSLQINDSACIACYRCLEECPQKGALEINMSLKNKLINISMNPIRAMILGVICILFVVSVAFMSGTWQTQDKTSMLKVMSLNTLQDIKGWMKWNDVIKTGNLDEEKIIKELKIDKGFKKEDSIKNLGAEFGFTTEEFIEVAEKNSVIKKY